MSTYIDVSVDQISPGERFTVTYAYDNYYGRTLDAYCYLNSGKYSNFFSRTVGDSSGEYATHTASITVPSDAQIGTNLKVCIEDDDERTEAGPCYIAIVAPNAVPSAPEGIFVPRLRAGKSVTVSWGSSIDPDGMIVSYELSRKVGTGSWKIIGTMAGLSMTDTIGEDWTSVSYRVRAKDNDGAWSSYTTSAAVEVESSAVAMQTMVEGVEREVDMLLAGVDGVSREVDSMAVGINGVTVS